MSLEVRKAQALILELAAELLTELAAHDGRTEFVMSPGLAAKLEKFALQWGRTSEVLRFDAVQRRPTERDH
jgi:hypothetical protein